MPKNSNFFLRKKIKRFEESEKQSRFWRLIATIFFLVALALVYQGGLMNSIHSPDDS